MLRTAGLLVPGVERLAVLRANSIGDFVLIVPALDALRAAYPSAEITVLGSEWHPGLIAGRPGPWDGVQVVPPYAGLGGQVPEPPAGGSAQTDAFFADQRARGYDLAVQLHGGGASSNPFVRRLGARVTAGARDGDAAELDRWMRYSAFQHETVRCLEIVGLVGAPPVTLEPRLTVTPEDRDAAAALFPPSGRRLVALHAGANDPRRRWPVERFAAVGDAMADALAPDGADVVLIGHGSDDADAAKRISSEMRHPTTDLVGGSSFSATLGLLERAALFIGNDSGPRHLAAAVGVPTVGIFWCGNLITAGPPTRRHHRVAVSFENTCSVCGVDQTDRRCAHDPSFVTDVPVEEVVRYALDLLAEADLPGQTSIRTPEGKRAW